MSEYSKQLVDKGLSVSQHLSVEVEENEIKHIHTCFNPCTWYEVGRFLDLEVRTLDPLKNDASCESMRLFKVFDLWRSRGSATYLNLLVSISSSSSIDLKPIIPKLINYLAEEKFKIQAVGKSCESCHTAGSYIGRLPYYNELFEFTEMNRKY